MSNSQICVDNNDKYYQTMIENYTFNDLDTMFADSVLIGPSSSSIYIFMQGVKQTVDYSMIRKMTYNHTQEWLVGFKYDYSPSSPAIDSNENYFYLVKTVDLVFCFYSMTLAYCARY